MVADLVERRRGMAQVHYSELSRIGRVEEDPKRREVLDGRIERGSMVRAIVES